MSDEIAQPRHSRAPLWILIAMCVAPIAASYVAFYWWQPSDQVNYGELLEPRAVAAERWVALDGAPEPDADLLLHVVGIDALLDQPVGLDLDPHARGETGQQLVQALRNRGIQTAGRLSRR